MPLFWEVRSSLGWSFRSECKRKPGLARTEGSSSSSSTNRGNNHYSACQAFGRKQQWNCLATIEKTEEETGSFRDL
ncbi:Ankyrin repeat domain-containing protein 23 [Fusarium oxysporum f. sp. albedinis]|nr:Ankyrin repeat domain-containing protein 23 [Fusarium oxysporum f. sp. albedinis]